MINNYKAKKVVRAEANGEIYKGRPASVYIKEDEYKVENTNLIDNGDFETGSVLPWVNDDMDTFEISTSNATKTYALHMTVGDASDKASVSLKTNTSKTYKLKFNRIITNLDSGSDIKFTIGTSAGNSTDGLLTAYASNSSTGRVREEMIFTPSATTTYFSVVEFGTSNDADIYIDDIQCVEITDFSYKLMAISDTLPAVAISTGGLMNEMLSSNQETFLGNALDDNKDVLDFGGNNGDGTATLLDSDGFTASNSTFDISSSKAVLTNNSSAQGYVSLPIATISGHKYILSIDVKSGGNSNVDICLNTSATWNTDNQNLNNGVGANIETGEYTANDGTSFLLIRNTSSTNTEYSHIDNVKVYGVYGYDSIVAPQNRGGLVTNIWDASTGKLKDPSVDGDIVEIQFQGECTTSASGGDSETIEKIITRISNTGFVSSATVEESNIPNSIGVVSDPDKALSNENDIILWQGVEPPRFFTHKNSVTVKAKCSEAITRYRPVSLYLNSSGDLLCKQDDIPNEAIPSDRDYMSAPIGKWGIPELDGATNDIIPITVAGKTHINTSTGSLSAGDLIGQLKQDGTVTNVSGATNNYVPNSIGTLMEGGTGDVAITIFAGVPTGPISDLKNIVKITANAVGNVVQYCPVSIFLDENGNYKCIADDIPNNPTDDENAIWIDNRKWGIAQSTVSVGSNVDIIVKGRTKVVDTLDSADRTEWVTKISSVGVVTSSSTTAIAFHSLGIVETEAKASTNTQGTIIIY